MRMTHEEAVNVKDIFACWYGATEVDTLDVYLLKVKQNLKELAPKLL